MGRLGIVRLGRTAAALMVGIVLSAAEGRAETACLPGGQAAEVATVLDDLDLALDDGRVVRLAGIDPARATPRQPQLGKTARIAVDRWLSGARVLVQPLASAADRWDRWPALVYRPRAEAPDAPGPDADASAVSVNAALTAMGWARAKPEASVHACFASLLAGEAEARTTALGLWADPYYAIVPADDAAGLATRSGGMALVDGHLGLRNGRAGLLVTLGGGSGFMATMSRRAEKSLAKAGVDLQKLVGTEVRIRGLLDDRFGPRIDLVDADQIEQVGQPKAASGAKPSSGMREPEADR